MWRSVGTCRQAASGFGRSPRFWPPSFTTTLVGIGTSSPQATLDINAYAKLKLQASAPLTCDATHNGAIAPTTTGKYLCVCDNTNS